MPWADDLGSCVTDVIASRPDDPLKQLAHLLSQPNARPNWEETATAYAKRHNLEQQLARAIDAAGLTALQEAPPDAIDRLCRELLTCAQPQVTSTATTALQEEVASLKREVGRLHDDRLAAPQPRSMATSGGTVLALALGGSSDVIGALAWARACGYERLVLVQPGSPPRGTASASLELQPVQPAAPGTPAPGGCFFDNGSMVAYLLSLGAEHLVAGYYLVQPKDDGGGKGFSRASLEGTAAALVQVLAAHKCSALVGLDFGGDVALPEEETQRGGVTSSVAGGARAWPLAGLYLAFARAALPRPRLRRLRQGRPRQGRPRLGSQEAHAALTHSKARPPQPGSLRSRRPLGSSRSSCRPAPDALAAAP